MVQRFLLPPAIVICLWCRYAPAAEKAVTTPEGGGIMGMKVVRDAAEPGRITVTTTGAKYVLDGKGDEIRCFQRIGAERLVGRIRVAEGAALKIAALETDSVSDRACVLKAGKVAVTIRNDSLVRFAGIDAAALTLSVEMKNARRRDVSTRRRGFWGYDRDIRGFFDGKGGMIAYGDTPAFAVMPPRNFRWKPFFDLRPTQLGCELWGFKGTDKVIDENVRRGVKLFVIWGGTVWETNRHDARKPFEPKNEAALRRVIARIHKLGAKVMLYMVSGQLGNRATPAVFMKRIDNVVKKYKVDGVYHDSPSREWTRGQMYNFLRDQKGRFPDLLCFMHMPLDPLAEAYLDAKIIGEFDRKKVGFNPDAMDSRNWSNALVFWVPDHNMGRNVKAVDTVLSHRARMYWGFLPDTDLPGKPRHIRLWKDYYTAKLDLMRADRLHRKEEITPAEYATRTKKLRAAIRRFRRAEKSDEHRIATGLRGKATASSQEWIIYYPDDYVPGHATDGDLETCWLAAADRPNKWDWFSDHEMSLRSLSQERMAEQWLKIDLGRERTIGRVVYNTHWPGEPADGMWQEAFCISGSKDGRKWTPLLKKAGLKRAGRFDVRIDPTTARYIRVDGIRSRCRRVPFWHAAYVTELQVFAPK
jgi:hypothetical protein